MKEHIHRASQPTIGTKYLFPTYAQARKWARRMKTKHQAENRVFVVVPCGGQFAIGTRDKRPTPPPRSGPSA